MTRSRSPRFPTSCEVELSPSPRPSRVARVIGTTLLLSLGLGLDGRGPVTVLARGTDDPLPETLHAPADTVRSPGAASGYKLEIRRTGAAADSANPMRQPGAFTRIMNEADSAVKARGGPKADDAQLYLSWDAPWGEKRARAARMPACGDSLVRDTLYLSVFPGRTAERFTGFTAQLLVHATGGDTLGPWWHMESRGGENPGSMSVEWAAQSPWARRQPFRSTGQGFVILDHTASNARLRMVYAVPYDQSGPIAADSVYTLARIILRHRPERRLAGCEQPVVIEWAQATLAFGPKDEPSVSRGERFATFSGPASLADPFRGVRVQGWKPKAVPAKVPGRP